MGGVGGMMRKGRARPTTQTVRTQQTGLTGRTEGTDGTDGTGRTGQHGQDERYGLYGRTVRTRWTVLKTYHGLNGASVSVSTQRIKKQVMEEDDFADTFCQQQCTLGRERLKRQLFLFGWPWEFQKCGNPDKFDETMEKFRGDCIIFNTIKDFAGAGPELIALVRRHVGHKAMVKQFQQSLPDLRQPQYKDDIMKITRKRGRVATGTHIVEEVIGSQKSCKRLKLACKYKRPEKGMLTTLEHHVLDGRHHYSTAPVDQPVAHRGSLPPNAFGYDYSTRSLPFSEIASTSQVPQFYTTSGNQFSVHHADPPMFREIQQRYDSRWNIVADAWQGGAMDVAHRIIVQHVDMPGDRWLHAWYHFPSSTCLMWPGTIQSFNNSDGSHKFFAHALEVREPLFMACFDVKKWRCYSFKWRSYAWQVYTYGEAAAHFPVRHLPVLDGGINMLMEVVSDKAFYKMTRRQWEQVAAFTFVASNMFLYIMVTKYMNNK